MTRGGEATASSNHRALFAGMLERVSTDPLWAAEYQDYVRQVSFAAPGELIGFDQALQRTCWCRFSERCRIDVYRSVLLPWWRVLARASGAP